LIIVGDYSMQTDLAMYMTPEEQEYTSIKQNLIYLRKLINYLEKHYNFSGDYDPKTGLRVFNPIIKKVAFDNLVNYHVYGVTYPNNRLIAFLYAIELLYYYEIRYIKIPLIIPYRGVNLLDTFIYIGFYSFVCTFGQPFYSRLLNTIILIYLFFMISFMTFELYSFYKVTTKKSFHNELLKIKQTHNKK
jgi:hypothetical protein